jgi:hypothetical protein
MVELVDTCLEDSWIAMYEMFIRKWCVKSFVFSHSLLSDVIYLIYSIESREWFEELRYTIWPRVEGLFADPEIAGKQLVVLGNKCDWEDRREVSV